MKFSSQNWASLGSVLLDLTYLRSRVAGATTDRTRYVSFGFRQTYISQFDNLVFIQLHH